MIILLFALTISIFFFTKLFSYSATSFRVLELDYSAYIYYSILVFTFFGIFFVAITYPENNFWGVIGISEKAIKCSIWACIYFAIFFPVGMIFSNLLILRKLSAKKFLINFSGFNTNTRSQTDNVLTLMLIISVISIIIVFINIGYLPLFKLFNLNNWYEIAVLRIEIKFNYQGSYIIRDIVALGYSQIVSVALYARMRSYNTFKSKLLFIISFIFTSLICLYDFEKSIILGYFIMIMICHNSIPHKTTYQKKFSFSYFYFISIALASIILFGFLTTKGETFTYIEVIKNFCYRIFVAQSAAIFLAFEHFPNNSDFLGIISGSNILSTLFDVEYLNYGRKLFLLYSKSSFDDPSSGLIVGNMIAEAWIRLGWIGLLSAPLLGGFYVQLFNLIIKKYQKSPISLAMMAYTAVSIPIHSEFIFFLFPWHMIKVVIFTVISLYFSRFLLTNNKNHGY
jgi:hypothetical protein